MKTTNKKKLAPYESNLQTALYSDYSRNLPSRVFTLMDEIYYDETGIVNKTNTSCAHCCLKTLKMVAKLYFKEENNTAKTT